MITCEQCLDAVHGDYEREGLGEHLVNCDPCAEEFTKVCLVITHSSVHTDTEAKKQIEAMARTTILKIRKSCKQLREIRKLTEAQQLKKL